MKLSVGLNSAQAFFAGRRRQIILAACVLIFMLGVVAYVAVSRIPIGGPATQQQIAQLKKAIKDDPHDANTRVSLATAYYQAGAEQRSIAELKTALKLNDSHQGALILLGDIYMEQDNYKDAIPLYEKVVELNPVDRMLFPSRQIEGAYYQLGAAYLKTKNFSDAAMTLENTLLIDGSDADAWYLLGNTYQELGEVEKAVECYKKAVRYVPNYTESYQAMAKCYEKLGQNSYADYAKAMVAYSSRSAQEAVTQLEKVTAEQPAFVEGFLGLALAYEKIGASDKAAGAYQKVLSLDPENWLATAKLGR